MSNVRQIVPSTFPAPLSDAQRAALELLDGRSWVIEYEVCSRDVALKLARLGLIQRVANPPARTRLTITDAGRAALRGAS